MKQTLFECESFIKKLASSSPTPGGGGASALVGAVAAALASMVANITLKNNKDDALTNLITALTTLQKDLLILIEEDAKAFLPLAAAYKLPAKTAKEQAEKEQKKEEALKNACHTPLQIMQKCCQVIDICIELKTVAKPIVISDIGVGITLCKSALEGASLNVFCNTKLMNNREIATELNKEAKNLLSIFCAKSQQLFFQIKNQLLEER